MGKAQAPPGPGGLCTHVSEKMECCTCRQAGGWDNEQRAGAGGWLMPPLHATLRRRLFRGRPVIALSGGGVIVIQRGVGGGGHLPHPSPSLTPVRHCFAFPGFRPLPRRIPTNTGRRTRLTKRAPAAPRPQATQLLLNSLLPLCIKKDAACGSLIHSVSQSGGLRSGTQTGSWTGGRPAGAGQAARRAADADKATSKIQTERKVLQSPRLDSQSTPRKETPRQSFKQSHSVLWPEVLRGRFKSGEAHQSRRRRRNQRNRQ